MTPPAGPRHTPPRALRGAASRVALLAAAAACLVAGILVALTSSCGPASPAAGAAPTFVGSKTCETCHTERHGTWMKTAHAYALREATPEVVVGDFNGVTVPSERFRTTPYRREDGGYAMRVERDPQHRRPGEPAVRDYVIVRAIGVSLQQAYLALGEAGDWQLLPLTWNLATKSWNLTHLVLTDISGEHGYYSDYRPEEHAFNHGCAQCHATNFDAGYDYATGRYTPSLLEGSVSCESCHGPGSLHVARHEAATGGKIAKDQPYAAPERLVQPLDDLDAQGVLDTCGRCHYAHSWRFAINESAKTPYWDLAVPQNYDRTGFFADGRTSGLNYEGTVQIWSKCFTKGGMSCISCHDLHGGHAFAMRWADQDDDRQCTQCHAEIGKAPSAHSHHKATKCVDCHMPKLLTGQLARWRDHSVQSPDPVLTERYGAASPNACNVCHQDKTPAWARAERERLWEPTPQQLVDDVGVIVRLRADGSSVSADELGGIVRDPARRLFFRTTSLWALAGRAGDVAADAILAAATDRLPDLRIGAFEILARRPDPQATAALLRAVRDDPSRVARIEAAYALVRAGWRPRPDELRPVYAEAKEMLRGRRVFHDAYERLAFLADALGEQKDVELYLSRLETIPQWKSTPWHPAALDLFQRRARVAFEAGDFARAAAILDRVAADHGSLPPLLVIADIGEVAHRRGDAAGALQAFDRLAAGARDGSVPRILAAAWRAKLRGGGDAERRALEAAVAAAESDPVAGEWLRRARSFLD